MGLNRDIKIQRPTGRRLLLLVPFALCYACFVVLGDWQGSVDYSNAQNLGRLVLWAAGSFAVLLSAGFLLENGAVLAECLPSGVQALYNRLFPPRKSRQGHWWIWLLFSLLCLLSYLPYYLMYYPTWFNNDAVWQMEQALGMAAKSNHHPYFHTLIIKVFLTVGYGLFHDYTAAVALYTFFQMALTAAVFGFYLYLLYRRGTRLLWLVLGVFFYALLPINGMFSICMGKDAWFTAAFLLFIWAVKNCDGRTAALIRADGQEKDSGTPSGRRWLLFFGTGLSVCLLRSNGIFVFFGTAFLLILWQLLAGRKTGGAGGLSVGSGKSGGKYQAYESRERQGMYLAVASVLACYLLWQGPVLSALRVAPPDTIESLTMPTQHLLCTYVRGGNLREEEVEMLEAVVPLEQIDDYYNPYLFDMTKNYIREHGRQQIIADNKGAYAELWLKAGLRNPMLYLEAEIRQTAGYYALHIPHDQVLYSEYFMVENPFGIENERKVFSYDMGLAMGEFLQWFQTFYNRVWSLGMNTWLLLFALACALYRGRRAIAFAPCVMLLGSLLLATPVYNEFRYAYGVFVALPLLFSVAFGREAG
ncbi:MAG: hypothetical protein K2M20_08310 [Lachnospiraceae bacterium]|nr:hypothetical protein [Lachnospiraceae bacterium]